MCTTLAELARLVKGTAIGDPDAVIAGAAIIRDAKPGDITLADKAKLAAEVAKSQASAVVVADDFTPAGMPYIRVANVHTAFAIIVAHFRPQRQQPAPNVSPQAFLSDSAKIGHDVTIHAGATISDDVQIGDGAIIHSGVRIMAGCRIGASVTIFPNAVLYEDTVVGDRCIIHAGAIIGSYGCGYHTVNGKHQLSAQLGNVEIGPDVDIGAGATIDRGTYGSTRIGEGTKLDNQVHIAHNVRIGRHNIIVAQVGIAGSSTTGDYVVMAGQVGVGDHLHIGDQVTLGAKAGVMSDIPDGEAYVGIPATPVRDQMVKQAALSKLPEMRKQFKEMQRQLDELECQIVRTSKKDAA